MCLLDIPASHCIREVEIWEEALEGCSSVKLAEESSSGWKEVGTEGFKWVIEVFKA